MVIPRSLAPLLLWSLLAAGMHAAERPNIVLIMADDMGWSDAGCYGGEICTPHIDSLARRGLRFSRFYNNAICGPTRASLLTGLYCQQVGHPGDRWNEPKDFTKCATIAELLKANGYHTMMVGKWQGRDLAVKRGFDRFFGPNCRALISYHNVVVNNEFYLNDQPWVCPDEDFFMTDAFSAHAAEFLQEAVARDQPFFLYAAYIAPHWPLHARERDIAAYRKRYLKAGWDQHRAERFRRQRGIGLIPASWKLSPPPQDIQDWSLDRFKAWQAERMSVYAAQITCMDRGIGRILELVKSSGLEENTLVIFLSDNGAAQDGGLVPSNSGFGQATGMDPWRLDGVQVKAGSGPDLMPGPDDTFAAYGRAWANVSNAPLNGFKAGVYEGGIRTPLVVRWPRVIRSGSAFTRQAGHVMDLMATCLDAAGISYPRVFEGRKLVPLEGKSLVPVFAGKERAGHEQICWSAFGNAILMGDWKLLTPRQGMPWELYNLMADGTETTNLAADYPQRVKRMSARFEAWRKRVGAR
jgi:arylsulfatase A-like enzyme